MNGDVHPKNMYGELNEPQTAHGSEEASHHPRQSGKRFYKITSFDGEFSTSFVFGNGQRKWQLRFNRMFLGEIHPDAQLQLFLDSTVFPAIQDNPDRRIEVGSDGGVTITEQSR